MARKTVYHRSIPDDLSSALDYYEDISPALANRFRAAVNQTLDEIERHPESYAVDVPPIHFAKVDRFPYLIFFAFNDNYLSINAILYGGSDPAKWRDRTS